MSSTEAIAALDPPAPGGGVQQPADDPRADLRSFSREGVEQFVAHIGEPRYRARQLYRWIHVRDARSFDEMTDLPAPLRARLNEHARLTTFEVELESTADDGTRKFKLRTPAGDRIESVWIPDGDRRTLCISTQVGCAMGCTFCLTARMGFVRNLSAGEIVGQVSHVRRTVGEVGERISNIVLMGMGEPLHNYNNVVRALSLMTDDEALNFSRRRVTLSTSGLVTAIDRLGQEPVQVNLAISLNGSTDAQREATMPVNRRWNIAELMAACRRYPLGPRRRITFEYVLLRGVNDALEDAARVAGLVRGIQCKVNVIPFNPDPRVEFQRPDDAHVEAFKNVLIERGVCATVRFSRGRDINAACGQLVVPEDARQRRRGIQAGVRITPEGGPVGKVDVEAA